MTLLTIHYPCMAWFRGIVYDEAKNRIASLDAAKPQFRVQLHKDKGLQTQTCLDMVLLDAVKLSKGTLHDEANMLARLRAVKCELEFPDLCSPSSSALSLV